MSSFHKSLLILGSGGREHALAWKLSQSSLLSPSATIYVAPGNGGTALPVAPSATHGPSVAVVNAPITATQPHHFPALVQFCRDHHVGLVVVGPEDPLANGVTDALTEAGIACFGPSKAAAQLEGSKAYCKEFMVRHGIPTASYQTFSDLVKATDYVKSLAPSTKLVVKASGLAAGKGVLMCAHTTEALTAIDSMLGPSAVFGSAGSEVVIEEWLEGVEASILAFSDGKSVRVLPAAQDHKRRFEFDRGLNTGGMGAFAPSPTITPALTEEIVETVMQRAVDGCNKDCHPFIGVLFAGLMLTSGGPKVLEFNVRFGDPETQVVLPLLDTDLLLVMLACIEGRLKDIMMEWKQNVTAATIVAVSEGYPEAYKKGRAISGQDSVHYTEDNHALVFQAGTEYRKDDKSIVTSGGRVLAVTALAPTLSEACTVAYDNLSKISFEGIGYRRDIGRSWHQHRPNNKLRLAVLGSTRGTDLVPILEAINANKLNAEVCVVISNTSKAGILDKAQRYKIPAFTVTSKGKNREEFDRECLSILHSVDVDLVLLIGFMRIISPVLIDAYYNRILNVHPSLLPAFAGGMDLDVHQAVIDSGATETGCTVHLIDNGPVDGGPILVQKRCRVLPTDTSDSLKSRVQSLEGQAFIEAIQLYNPGQHFLSSIAQGLAVESQSIIKFYRRPALSQHHADSIMQRLNALLKSANIDSVIDSIDSEYSYYIDFEPGVTWTSIGADKRTTLEWLLRETFEPENLSRQSFLTKQNDSVVEVGPRLSFTSAWSTNACSICRYTGLKVQRLERFRRFAFQTSTPLSSQALTIIGDALHDRMTEQVLSKALLSFETLDAPEPWFSIPLLEEGMTALVRVNSELGLALDDFDQQFIYDLFVNKMKRNPTNVELFDISQSNSEHSRHWFFRGDMEIDGVPQSKTLFQLVKETLEPVKANSIIAFADNSSAIRGFQTSVLETTSATGPAPFRFTDRLRHLLLTAETHNFPSGVAPFPGAETGTGGRLRDTAATGRGSLVSAGISAYCVGQLHIEGYELPWEDKDWQYPSNLATPLKIAVEASNGASDYGNKFGEPVVAGFARSFGLRTLRGERREWIKPIMFSAGIGFIDENQRYKGTPEAGMLAVKIGGPAYRIGMGGSAASSMVQGENKETLDFNAVQRGDAEMEQKVNRVIRVCCELGDANPIVSIHDQGAGGNCNVLKEIVDPAGGKFDIRAIQVGDATLSVLEIWGAEYQENWALLIRANDKALFDAICLREKAPVSYVGEVTGDGVVTVYDSRDNSKPVELDLKTVLGEIPMKKFQLRTVPTVLAPIELPGDLTMASALNRVLRLMSVGSKRWLTNKVDRSVTGLVAQQQCVGPLQLPLANCSVIAVSHTDTTGVASAVGEQPIKGLLSPAAMARVTVGEALTNIVFADLSAITDIKCSGNWMWAAKLEGEGAALYEAAVSMRQVMLDTGISVDGGKDSLSMAARAPDGETVKAPPTLVVTLYGPCVDITHTVTPDIKAPGQSTLIHLDFSGRVTSQAPRLGGSSLATVFGALGSVAPDMDDSAAFVRAWQCVQHLVKHSLALSGHDVSDGGLSVTVMEMAFAGNCGLSVNVTGEGHWTEHLFGEELGVVLEIHDKHLDAVNAVLEQFSVRHTVLGRTNLEAQLVVEFNGATVLSGSMTEWRDVWEETSFQLERLQCDPQCVESEQRTLKTRTGPNYQLAFQLTDTPQSVIEAPRSSKPKVAIIREEGSNGDREMAAAFIAAGFDAWDVSMTDLLTGRIHLNAGSVDDGRPFRGVAFVGGFSYADVLDSAKGWASVILKNDSLWSQFSHFYSRPDTFSLGVCNGCQLMALLGWVPYDSATVDHNNPPARFIHNASGRYESRWTTVKIESSESIFLQGMEGSVLGIWVSHGEGRAHFPSMLTSIDDVKAKRLAPIRYVDDSNTVTETYPFNANGSPAGIAALSSEDGRHLALMPHPERCHRSWACPYLPHSEDPRPPARQWHAQYSETSSHSSPWIKLFQNARHWCDRTSASILYGANIEKQLYEEQIRARLASILNETNLSLFSKKVGKVRDTYVVKLSDLPTMDVSVGDGVKGVSDDSVMVLITTDRISAFDRLIACIPCKGSVLNRVSNWWFEQSQAIIPNHVLATPHPNVTIGKLCKPFPIEFVARAYLTGSTSTSLWTHYNKGSRNYCGHALEDGWKKNQQLPRAILTPTTKSDEHDRPISAAEIVSEGWMTAEHWAEASDKALKLFALGQRLAAEHGLILVDTKYEFGLDNAGSVILIDEIHTPDSSRYWIASSYQQRFNAGLEPEMIDKEFLRIWYTQHCDPYADTVLPTAPTTLVTELSRRYILLYEMITGKRFQFAQPGGDDDVCEAAIERATMSALAQIKKASQQHH